MTSFLSCATSRSLGRFPGLLARSLSPVVFGGVHLLVAKAARAAWADLGRDFAASDFEKLASSSSRTAFFAATNLSRTCRRCSRLLRTNSSSIGSFCDYTQT